MKLRKLFLMSLVMISSICVGQEIIPQDPLTTMEADSTFTDLVLGTETTPMMFTVYILFGLFGFVISIAFDIYSSGVSGKEVSLKHFWDDNKWRVLLSLFVIIVAILFSEDVMEMKMGNWSSFIAGFTADKIIENLMQRRRRKMVEGQ